jgi:hypothetical protein
MASRAVFELVERLMVTAKAFNRVREQLVHPARIHCPTQRHVTNTGLEVLAVGHHSTEQKFSSAAKSLG